MNAHPKYSGRFGPYGRLILALCLLASGCTARPSLLGRSTSQAMSAAEAASTRLGQAVALRAAAHPGTSGIQPLADARDAFAVRALLAGVAERTLDVQYYIWHPDSSGTLLLDALRAAAGRGVRVRLLLDDNGTAGMDAALAALDEHPNVEVRLFNPFTTRSPKWLGYVTDFSRANRRMHNKSFTADGVATIIGGRNVGDEYFGATKNVLFSDLDVLAAGPIASEVGADFDRYWASQSSYPAASVLPVLDKAQRTSLHEREESARHGPDAEAYLAALRKSESIAKFVAGELGLQWVGTRMVSDDSAKGLKAVGGKALLIHQLDEVLGAPAASVDLVSPYFVPTQSGVDMFAALVRRGVRVQVLTNALESTDVAAVHAGYSKRRKSLLAAGVSLYEMRRSAAPPAGKTAAGPFGSSGSSLHAKTFAVDGQRVFVGSFNFDPRSTHLNTELGFVIDSPPLAQGIGTVFDTTMRESSYEVRLDEAGRLYWIERREGQEVRHATEPGAGLIKRAGVGLLSVLPIEWML